MPDLLIPAIVCIFVVPVVWLVIALCCSAATKDEASRERAFREWKEKA